MKKHFTLLMLFLLNYYLSHAQATLSLQQFSTGYTAPVAIENCGDSRLFIVQESGQIYIADSTGTRLSKPFLDISKRVRYSGEQGLLGLAFDPNYTTNGSFYVYYIDTTGSTQVSRFKVSSSRNVANASSEHKILNIQQPFTNHKGGCIHFGTDGYLYISTGDGGSGGDPNNNAQNPQSLLGKILRIDVHHGTPTSAYIIPPTNPFVDSSNYRPEIWALGLRNPWRWSFDSAHTNMIIADVGQDNYEEVNFQSIKKGGKNYGWRCYEGFHAYNTAGCNPQSFYQSPVYEYDHSTGDCAIIGGYIYRGSRYTFLQGKYLFTDYCSGKFRTLQIDYPHATEQDLYTGDANSYTCFGQDNKRELYIANETNGTIYHIAVVKATIAAGVANIAPSFSVAPNPSHGNFVVNYKSDKVQQVIIHIQNTLGQQFYASRTSLNAGNNNLNLNVRIPHGDYFISITDAAGRTSNQRLRIE